MKKYILLFVISLTASYAFGQDQPKDWIVSGYVKNMQTFFNPSNLDQLLQDNLIHNRINFRWYINDDFTFSTELRNRIHTGDLVRFIPAFKNSIRNGGKGYFDGSKVWLDKQSIIIHSMVDRLYLDYVKGPLEIRVGRQRINWGINTVWNPNDLFNVYSFTDFDYEERPGTDAILLRYYTGLNSSVEIAVEAFDNWSEATIAGLWKINKWNYDFQLLAGYREDDLVLGGGWAGNIKNAGFKGEFSFFNALEPERDNSFSASTGIDYAFSNSLFISGGFLYNSNGDDGNSLDPFNANALDAKNLYPFTYSFFFQSGYPLTPLLTANIAVIFSPGEGNTLFLNPGLQYSIKENWDVDLIGQIFFGKEGSIYKGLGQGVFIRLKYSY